ncbi:hypothetical protein SpCBS45565_g00053 [Spizellomyces sp. 'palustris']|nr:hypothetical protein SpCBS45565_g00053 [Spizellomyces sp. 'palustris']
MTKPSLTVTLDVVVRGSVEERIQAWVDLLDLYRTADRDGTDPGPLTENEITDLILAIDRDLAAQEKKDTTADALVRGALRCAALFLHRGHLIPGTTREQWRGMLQGICKHIVKERNPKLTCLGVWCLSVQRVEDDEVLAEMGPAIIEALMAAMKYIGTVEVLPIELLNALDRLFKRVPTLAPAESRKWVVPVLELMFSSTARIADAANTFFRAAVEYFVALRKGCEMHIKALTNEKVETLIEILRNNIDHTNVYNAWGHVMLMLGSTLHRTQHLNALLQVVENGFNSSVPANRLSAFRVWRRLIINFAQKDHLIHDKRVKLVLLPLLNGFKYEKSATVRMECMKTYVFLLVHLSYATALLSFTESTVLPVAKEIRKDRRLVDVFLTAVVINVVGKLHTVPADFDLRQSLSYVDEPMIGPYLQHIVANLPSGEWSLADYKVFLYIMEMAIDRCKVSKQLIPKVQLLWEHVVAYVNDSIADHERNLSPLVDAISFLWKTCVKTELNEFSRNLAEMFRIEIPERAGRLEAEQQELQYRHAKAVVKMTSKLVKLLEIDSSGRKNVHLLLSDLAAQYQVAPDVSPIENQHRRTQTIINRLSSDGHHSSPRKENLTGHSKSHGNSEGDISEYVQITDKKKMEMQAKDERILTPRQMEKRAERELVPAEMYETMDKSPHSEGMKTPTAGEKELGPDTPPQLPITGMPGLKRKRSEVDAPDEAASWGFMDHLTALKRCSKELETMDVR